MKKKTTKIILIIIILAIILAGTAYAYVSTDILKTEKQLFAKYLINNIEQLAEFNIEPYGSVFEKNKNENLQIKINGEVIEEDNKGTIDSAISIDSNLRKCNINYDSKINEDEFAKIDMVLSDEILGIKINGIHDKYLSIKNENLKEVLKRFGIEENELDKIPDKIDFSGNTNVSVKKIEKTEKILKKHSKVFRDLLEKGEYEKNKGVEVEINNETFKTDKYTCSIFEKEVIKTMLTFANNVINDKEFINLYNNELGSDTLTELQENITYFMEETEIEENDSKITIGVYEYKGKTIKTDIVMEESEMFFFILNSKNNSTILLSSKEKMPEDEEIYYPRSEHIIRIQNNINGENGQLIFETEHKYDKKDIEMLNKREQEENEEYEYWSNMDYSEWYEDSSQKYIINSVKKDDNNIETNLDLSDSDEGIETEIKINVVFGNTIKFKELNEENSLILNDYTKEDLEKLGEELSSNAEKTAQENPEWFLSFFFLLNDPILSTDEYNKEQLSQDIKEALNLTIEDSIDSYNSSEQTISRTEYTGKFLTIENIKQNCTYTISELENIGNNTFKVIYFDDEVYFAKITLTENDGNITVENVEIFTEEEYSVEEYIEE